MKLSTSQGWVRIKLIFRAWCLACGRTQYTFAMKYYVPWKLLSGSLCSCWCDVMLPLHLSTTKCSPWVPSCCLWFTCCFKFNLVACSLIVFSDYSSSRWPLNSYRAFYNILEISLFFFMVFLLKFTYCKIYFFGYSSMSFDKCS